MGKQMKMQGIDDKEIQEIEDAAEALQAKKKKRMKASEDEKEAMNALIVVMKKHKRDVYTDRNANPPLHVIVSDGEVQVSIKELKGEATNDDDGGDGDGKEGEAA